MAVTHYDLTATFRDAEWTAFDPGSSPVVAWIETNVANTEGIVDEVANQIALGGSRKVADSTGLVTWTDLVGSDSDAADINLESGTLQYRVTAEYRNAITRRRERWVSGWFSLTADINLADVISETYVPAAWMTTATATLQGYVDQGEAVRDETQAIRDGIVGDLGTTDSQTATLVNGPSLTSAALSATLAPKSVDHKLRRYVDNPGRLYDDGADLGAWTVTGGTGTTMTQGSALTALPTNYSISGPSAGGGMGSADRAFFADLRRKFISLDIVPDANLSSIWILIEVRGTSSFGGKYISLPILPTNQIVVGLKQTVTIHTSAAVLNGGAVHDDLVDCRNLRIQVFQKAGLVTTTRISNLRYHDEEISGIVMTFDDGRADTYTTAFPLMAARGLIGNVPVIQDTVGGTVGGYNCMTLAQLHDLEDAGWEMNNHSKTHTPMAGMSAASIKTEIESCYNYLLTNGFRHEGARHFIYPGGSWDNNVLQMVQRRCRTGRNTGTTTFARCIEAPDLPSPMLRAAYITNGVTAAAAKSMVDTVKTRGGVAYLSFHSIVATEVATEDWSITKFTELVDHIQAQGVPTYRTSDVWGA